MDFRSLPINELRTFEAVARKESFTKAAEALGITQSAVSQQIKDLEALIGCRLLERSRSGASLTAAGKAMDGDVRKGLVHLSAALMHAIRLAGASHERS